jgi:hypothetical protein
MVAVKRASPRVLLSAILIAVDVQFGSSHVSQVDQNIKHVLSKLAAGPRGDEIRALSITLNHLHSLHGGLRLTIKGDGAVEQEAARTAAGKPKQKVTPDDLKALLNLLVKHEVWTQKVEERLPRPEESIASLRTCYGKECVEIWEWYNDLERNARINDVLRFMQQIAWQPPERWSLTIDTTGGLTGRGAGRVTISSSGSVSASGTPFATCPGKSLTSQQVQTLARAVHGARLRQWAAAYVQPSNPEGCCDQFRYSMTLDVEGAADAATEHHKTGWHSATVGMLPAELRALFDLAWAIKQQVVDACKSAK